MDMMEKIKKALDNTEVIKFPGKLLASFSSTTINYYLLSVPFYLEFEGKNSDAETIVREGKLTWEKPKLLTPSYMLRTEGFSDEARRAFEMLAIEDSDLAMFLYRLKIIKDADRMEIVSTPLSAVSEKIISNIEKSGHQNSAVIKGLDEFWDVSLSKFIHDMINSSAYYSQMPDLIGNNLLSLNNSGFPVVTRDSMGVPLAARKEIEVLFKLFEKGEIDAKKLKQELDGWGVFERYQDRFFRFFKKS